MGEEGLCRPEITEQFTFVQLSNGLILPKSMVPATPDEVDDFMLGILKQREERRRKMEEERKARQTEAAAEKRRKWREIQPSLFGDF